MKLRPPDPAVLRAKMEAQAAKGQRIAEGLLLKLHHEIYRRSDGRIGQKELGVPALLLSVPGHRTGKTQTVSLFYATDGDDLVLVASNGGADDDPQWFKNVVAHPDVDIQIGRQLQYAVAEPVPQRDQRYERLWRIANAGNRGRYYRYQQQTQRPIPLVLLHPGTAPVGS